MHFVLEIGLPLGLEAPVTTSNGAIFLCFGRGAEQ